MMGSIPLGHLWIQLSYLSYPVFFHGLAQVYFLPELLPTVSVSIIKTNKRGTNIAKINLYVCQQSLLPKELK